MIFIEKTSNSNKFTKQQAEEFNLAHYSHYCSILILLNGKLRIQRTVQCYSKVPNYKNNIYAFAVKYIYSTGQ